MFLQETHFNQDGNFDFACNLYLTAYLAAKEQKKAGVAILIPHSCSVPGKQLSPSPKILSRVFRQIISKFALFDLLRIVHPTRGTFSFLTSPHSFHSRIDYFLETS